MRPESELRQFRDCVVPHRFFPWPEDALSKVAEFFLAEVDLPDAHRANVVQHLVFSHTHVVAEAARFAETLRRYYYVTPKNYLDYIQNYHAQLAWNEKKVRLAARAVASTPPMLRAGRELREAAGRRPQ